MDYTRHHIVPSSRGGEETCMLPKEFHEMWHKMFCNLTPEEIIIFVEEIQILMLTEREITWGVIHLLREEIKSGFIAGRD